MAQNFGYTVDQYDKFVWVDKCSHAILNTSYQNGDSSGSKLDGAL